MKKASILDMPEDLLENDPRDEINRTKKSKQRVDAARDISLARSLTIETLMIDVANALVIPKDELNSWAQDAAFPESSLREILMTAKRLGLNPLLGQIAWEINLNHDYEVYIPIDGWITLIHREQSFQGLVFNQATETENRIPIWMECSIYRSDLIYPVTVREYYAELKTEHLLWQQIPCRMLRHKTLQQCARLAFGISVPYTEPIKEITLNRVKKICNEEMGLASTKQILREKLFTNLN